VCKNDREELHVHHRYYEKNKKPWEYDSSDLFCLCKDCHKTYGFLLEILESFLNPHPDYMHELIGYAVALNEIHGDRTKKAERGIAPEYFMNNNFEGLLRGYSLCLEMPTLDVLEIMKQKMQSEDMGEK
jgi:hypothetical protein